ncbi:hypothetical protein [Coleofasciculus sp.]|uniref:hypothetical protein n=1 Tax=Coleofasciculus sp. TaxID=3100458 RepID=UPI003A497D2D
MSFLPTGDKLPIVLQPDDGKLIDVLGDTVAIKITGEDTDGVYTVLENVSPPQGGPPLHLHHREDEAFYVLEGEFEGKQGYLVVPAPTDRPVGIPDNHAEFWVDVNNVPGAVVISKTCDCSGMRESLVSLLEQSSLLTNSQASTQ